MDTSDDWASDGPVDADTLDTVAAAVFKEHLDSLLFFFFFFFGSM
jgi:hypothetical protein